MICPHCTGKKTLPLNDPRGRREINCPVCGGQGQIPDYLFPKDGSKVAPPLPPPPPPLPTTVADQKKQGLLQTYAAIVAATRKYVKAKQLGDRLFDTSITPPSDFYVQSVKSQADAEAAHAIMFKLIGELETQEETYAAVKKEEDVLWPGGQRY